MPVKQEEIYLGYNRGNRLARFVICDVDTGNVFCPDWVMDEKRYKTFTGRETLAFIGPLKNTVTFRAHGVDAVAWKKNLESYTHSQRQMIQDAYSRWRNPRKRHDAYARFCRSKNVGRQVAWCPEFFRERITAMCVDFRYELTKSPLSEPFTVFAKDVLGRMIYDHPVGPSRPIYDRPIGPSKPVALMKRKRRANLTGAEAAFMAFGNPSLVFGYALALRIRTGQLRL